jgi:hypothetical protein
MAVMSAVRDVSTADREPATGAVFSDISTSRPAAWEHSDHPGRSGVQESTFRNIVHVAPSENGLVLVTEPGETGVGEEPQATAAASPRAAGRLRHGRPMRRSIDWPAPDVIASPPDSRPILES